jgi:hypothetical protein
MIDWIKFSERQPERDREYLCHYKSLHPEYACYIPGNYILWWDPIGKLFYNLHDGCSKKAKSPDYWAEINLPEGDPMPQEAPKLCKDCRWIFNTEDRRNPHCGHQKAKRSFVRGLPDEECEDLRRHQDSGPLIGAKMEHLAPRPYCGPEGRWWEAKEINFKRRPDVTPGLTDEERADYIDVLDKIRRWFQ